MRVCVWEEQIMKCKIQFKNCIKVMTELEKKKEKRNHSFFSHLQVLGYAGRCSKVSCGHEKSCRSRGVRGGHVQRCPVETEANCNKT